MYLKLNTVMAAALSVSFAMQANALPAASVSANPGAVQTLTADVQYRDVAYRRGRYDRYERGYRRRGDRGVGAAIGLGIVGALIAGGIAEGDARDRSGRCAASFRTYNPETGTYIANGGYERRCPYL